MNSIFTNHIDANSFLGLVTNIQKNNSSKLSGRKAFVKIESKEVLMNMALATVIIVMGLTIGSSVQHKMEISQYAALMQEADV